MEPYAGIFVSHAETDEWEATPGYPGTEFHALVEQDGYHAGLFRIAGDEPVTFPWTPEGRESVLVLEGSVRIEVDGATVAELSAGNIASFAPGTEMTWHVTTPFKDLYVIA